MQPAESLVRRLVSVEDTRRKKPEFSSTECPEPAHLPTCVLEWLHLCLALPHSLLLLRKPGPCTPACLLRCGGTGTTASQTLLTEACFRLLLGLLLSIVEYPPVDGPAHSTPVSSTGSCSLRARRPSLLVLSAASNPHSAGEPVPLPASHPRLHSESSWPAWRSR